MEISEAQRQELRDALPYMTEDEVAEALILIGDDIRVAQEQPLQTPAEFRSQLRIIANGEIRLFAAVAQPWQLADMEAMDPAWMAAIGAGPIPYVRRAWLERPKGHSKTDDTAGYLCWALTCSRRKVEGVIGAEDFDQAKLMRDHVETLNELNQFGLKINRGEIINESTGSSIKILTSDAPSTHGIQPEFIIADELCHWRKADMWDTLWASHGKKEWSVFVVLTNAGWIETWPFKTRAGVMADPEWHFSRLEGPTANWITAASLEAQRKHLTNPGDFDRLWLNQWVSGTGDGIEDTLLTAAIHHDLTAIEKPEPGMVCAAGLDLGVKRHRSALYVVGMGRNRIAHVATEGEKPLMPAGTYRLCYGRNWKPGPGKKVDLDQVEAEVMRVAKAYRCPVHYDPYQCEQLAQRLIKRGVRMVEVPQTPKNQQIMASALLETLSDGRLHLYPDPELIADLRAASLVDRQNGFKLVSPDDERGHGDALTATQLSLFGFGNGSVRAMSERERLASMLGITLEPGKEQPVQKPG